MLAVEQNKCRLTLTRLKARVILPSSPDLGLRTMLSLANLYSWSFPLVFNRHASITTSIGRSARLRGVPNTSSVPLPTTITVFVSDKIFRGSSRMMQIFQGLVSLSPITSLFWVITKNILANVSVENISTRDIVQRLKVLVYKDLMSKLYILTVEDSNRVAIHPTHK